ncbi:transporter substrate-binding domain-containing protein [uncultured Sunxiuqinia sp.]|uniref:transporter substrate-binding domain-containing protein n=1 Tax=uncultured Sunxiuqinia sp. TaxID=1573825 RepID=UPI002AA8E69B|nr:transporter substrate-binding domain-containing protein [uncultured Sunxiuqinia sp.]
MNPSRYSLKNGTSKDNLKNIKGLYKTGLILILCFGFITTFAEETALYKVGLPKVPGFMSRDQNGEVKGFPLVLFEKIAQDENIQYEWVDGSWNELFIKVQNEEINYRAHKKRLSEKKYLTFPIPICTLYGASFICSSKRISGISFSSRIKK